ncbi:DUF2723 domain-containing protein [Ichthyenterobacterium sp. W332]|uniref:DUF2723 domain-containing protein n=1 Tax=Microcosmobacter mediterraneus TaxID=3075607 RepID=A0ABU2YIM7_9FLAO|nr:DUF2723 domain-containing protein [Ichthyenterobacterium sp. W332]MDT0557741.1 DUF2723 domain-containing protein [Ichthyenterobacterium sp. W332]
MADFNFKKWQNIFGWSVFVIALITYSLTVEPTVSFWDTGEYILTSSKLQVGHPPGAPLFQMLGAFFSIFALEASQIGMMLNMMSAVSSAFTILFMFWSVILLLTKLAGGEENISKSSSVAIIGSAVVGSLAFAFTDTFWYNAVETEVYAMAIFIMSVMFYLALRWEKDMNKARGNKWLVLISFVIGLSFGVHFMGLLTIPAIGLIYYFKNYKTITVKNFIIANVVSVAVLLFIFKLLAPNILRFFSVSEIFFVNTIGLPFNSGSIIAGLTLIGLVYFGLSYSRKQNNKLLNTGILCIAFVVIGFSSWMMLPIRANANVIINENNPASARELLAYYNLEQYPETHLFYGPQFTELYSGADENQPFVDDKPKYEKDEKLGKYVIVNEYENAKQNYNSEHATFLPRMWSSEHAENYMMFTGLIDFKLDPELYSYYYQAALSEGYPEDQASFFANQEVSKIRNLANDFRTRITKGEVDYEDYHNFLKRYAQSYFIVDKPSPIDNITYMFQYQLGYMYWRYFMWNFTGRQNDTQGQYDDFNGNWISGIPFIDNMHIGMSQDNLPTVVKEDKARNTYYFLPLILGLIGLFFLFNRDKKTFWVMLVFFLFTGLAIQVYTNVRPFEPRERDYSVVGSFYVFALWIGFGVYAIFERMKDNVNNKFKSLPIIAVAAAVNVLLFLMFRYFSSNVESEVVLFICNALSVLFLIFSGVALTLLIVDIITFLVNKINGSKSTKAIVLSSLMLIVPLILAMNNWDDHDRSGRKTANAMAVKYLESCAPNAILFTIGDNDSFPLWYAQEIEGVRTDVRVVNTSLFQTDWYIDQMKRKAYESDPIPSQLSHDQYKYGTRDYIMYREISEDIANDTLSIKEFMNFISSDDPKTKLKFILQQRRESGAGYPAQMLNGNYFPTKNVRIPVNKDIVLKNGVVRTKDADSIVPYIDIKITDNAIYKNRLLMLDIIANNNWERPIYFSGGSFGDDDYIWMKDYLQLDGMCYKLVPIKTKIDRANPFDMGRVDADLMYEKVMSWDWGNSGSEDIYHDTETRRNGITYRGNLARLMEQLINEDKPDKAEKIADLAMEKMPVNTFGYYTLLEPYISAYYEIEKVEKGRNLYKEVTKIYQENLAYFSELSIKNQEKNFDRIIQDIERYRSLVDILLIYNDEEFAEKETKKFNDYLQLFDHFMQPDDIAPSPAELDRDLRDLDSLLNLDDSTQQE